MGRLQLGMQGPAHRLAKESDARLRFFTVHTAAANGVLDLLAHGLLDGIDRGGRCGPSLHFAVQREDLLDHSVLYNKYVRPTRCRSRGPLLRLQWGEDE